MTRLTSTESGPLEFNPEQGESTQKVKAVGNKIGWLHTLTDEKGASFDIVIKDALGRVKAQKKCSSSHERFGELVNIPTSIGEELNVSIQNVQGAKNVKVFLN
jgi:hypothetical protein